MSTLHERINAGSAAEVIPWLNCLFYGPPGAGKTYLAATAQDHPATSPVLVLDVEGGTATLRHRPDIMVVRIKQIGDLVKVHSEILKAVESGDPDAPKTTVVDSLTELQKLDMNDIMRALIQQHTDRDPDVPSQREWGKSSNHVRQIVRKFRDLPTNVIFTALDKTDVNMDTGSTRTLPNLPGKLAGEVPGFLDVVGYLHTDIEKGKIERRLQVQPTARVTAKDRLGVLGQVMVNPTIPTMWDLLHTNGAKKGKS